VSYNHGVIRNADEILDKLYTLDYLCLKRNIVAELVVLGGSGILLFMELNGKKFRPTRDIDVNLLATNNMEALISSLAEVNIGIVGGVMEVPPMEDFKKKDSLFELDVDFSAIRVYVPSIELLACCKIFSTREKDLIDLKETSILEEL
jgi:Nucleotidyltransferase of unknown function (DUF6036)